MARLTRHGARPFEQRSTPNRAADQTVRQSQALSELKENLRSVQRETRRLKVTLLPLYAHTSLGASQESLERRS
jgi:hypothetical protein